MSFTPSTSCFRSRPMQRWSRSHERSAREGSVEEMVFRFTHTISMDWILPGIPPTGKRVEIALLAVVQFDGHKLAHEHLYWDQASVLVQLGLLRPEGLPVVGAEGARSVLDRSVRLNELLRREKPAERKTAA